MWSRMDNRCPGSANSLTRMVLLCIVLCMFLGSHGVVAQRRRSSCYDEGGRPRPCRPPFVNAAFTLAVEATNTCGQRGRQNFCLQTSLPGATKSCDYCEARDPAKSHPPGYLTDFNNNQNVTWWQSETMLEGVHREESVNLTLHLGKSFDITYVRLKFHSSRPESFAIYKRTTEQGAWIPYQFYSASCYSTYNQRPRDIITRSDETKALCTDEFSDISPLTGGSVAFSTLEGRPSAYDFENSPVLQSWVTATDIRIKLDRLNTFGDEVFEDPNVLRSYFYAISDFAVGGRCKCNGHASMCEKSTGQGLEEKLVCMCEHHTAGADCGECEPFYNDRPWGRATPNDANECQACDCNGLSRRCYFDEDMFRRTGHGGHCMDCRDNTAGAHCERCKDFFYRRNPNDRCQPCNCDPTGAENEQCDQNGQCRCKPGVTGEKCDRCQPNYFDLGPAGCRPCQCFVAGCRDNNPTCVPNTGVCTCKEFVEGQNCDTCKPGYFNLEEGNVHGCMPCFCFGHASICTSATGYAKSAIESNFDTGRERWKGVESSGSSVQTEHNRYGRNLGLTATGGQSTYFLAPDRYLGDQRFSYNQFLQFSLQVGEEGGRPSVQDVVIEGDGVSVSAPIYGQSNPVPRAQMQDYKFRLSEHTDYQWTPRLSSFDFMRMLSNLTAIKIRGTYTHAGSGYLDNVKLDSARLGGGFERATHVEQCTCPEGFVGQFCESCAPGYRRDPAGGGPLARCIPCNCNGHSDACDINTGRCICQHNTAGDNCERCAPGYYGYALSGTPSDCQKCPCPDGGECVELLSSEVVCINCREGYTGPRCEYCADGYFGDPQGRNGPRRECQKCSCNDNIDPNAVGNCNSTTGECLKCIYNTGGHHCERCLTGFYGNALELPKGQCLACDCYRPGSYDRGEVLTGCHPQSGQCSCLTNVIGRNCDQCLDGYWNIDSGNGCELCRCDHTGSYNSTCEIHGGQCPCKDGVAGRTCSSCKPNHFGFGRDGCTACDCDPEGSFSLQCDERTGQCPCKTNIEGRKCDRCMENKYNKTAGCINCPPCYSLVQERVNIHRRKLNELRELIRNIGNNPGAINDTDFRRRMRLVNDSVIKLLQDARSAIEWLRRRETGGYFPGSDGPLGQQLIGLQDAIMKLMDECGRISNNIGTARQASSESTQDISAAERYIDDAEQALQEAEKYIESDGYEALRKAREAQEKFGQHSDEMTKIAKQAREEVIRQEEEAMRIEQTAKEALNTSQEALRIAHEAILKPGDTSREINQLRRDVSDGERLYEQTKTLSEESLKQAKQAYDDSLGIYTEVSSMRLPSVDTDELNAESQQIKDEASRIKDEADRLIEQHQELMWEVNNQKHEAEHILNNGIRQQQIADELLAEADTARGIAEEAVRNAESTLRDANDTLRTLKEFDDKVQKSKDEAQDALAKVDGIERLIEEAEIKTEDAHDNLAGAEADAIAARDIAKNAQSIAEMASGDAGDIRDEAIVTKERTQIVREKSEKLASDVAEAEDNLEEYERQAEEDRKLAQEALQKADQAATSATESSKRVKNVLDSVTEISRILANLDTIDIDRLNKLETDLNAAEQQLVDANLETRYQSLVESQRQQAQWVWDYSNELRQLRLDVQNIQVINATIPRECFRTLVLEPTDPTG